MDRKQNKIFLFSVLAIAVMGAYLLFGDFFRTSDYSSVINIKGDAEEIVIKKPSAPEIKLFKKEGLWVTGKNSYPADADLIKNIEKDLKGLKISDQISKGEFLHKYDLDPEKAVEIKITYSGNRTKTITAGKKSSTGNHIYIRIDGKPEIYLAAGRLDSLLSKSEDDFRNREIVRIPSFSVDSFEITYKGRSFSFTRKSEEKSVRGAESEGKPAGEDKKVKVDTWICRGFENEKLDTDKINSIIADFNPLRVSSFLNDEKIKQAPAASVKIKYSGKDFQLEIFEKEKDSYFVKSSGSDYLFMLEDHIIKKYLLESIDTLKAQVK